MNSYEFWQYLKPKKRMQYLLDTGHLSDCSFSVLTDGEERMTIKCHKFVLICSSPVFERMFNGDFYESRNPENIVLDDVNAADFKLFIQYLYLNDGVLAKSWNFSTLQNLIYLGKKYMVDDLTHLCFSLIIKSIPIFTTEEIFNVYIFANQMENKELLFTLSCLFHNYPIEFFESPAIFDLSKDYFLSFITICDLNDHYFQIDLCNVIAKYCTKNGLFEEAPGTLPLMLCQKKTENVCNNEATNGLELEIQSTAGNETNDKTETEEKEASKEENIGVGKKAQNKEYIAKLLRLVKYDKVTASEFCSGPGHSSMVDFVMKYVEYPN